MDIKKSRANILIVAFLVLMSSGSATVDKKAVEKKEGRLMAPQKTDEEFVRLKEEAMDGSVKAAAELQDFYSYWMLYPEAIFWGTVAAENGKIQASRYNLGELLARSPDPLQRRRARFWLKKEIAEKSEYSKWAQDILEKLDTGKTETPLFPERYPKW